MGNLTRFRIAVLPGDGIGHEIMPSCLEVLNAAAARTGAFTLDCESREAGADCRPWELDVFVTENMFGDILSGLGAGLMGGLGFAPSADIGDEFAVFQPCHGIASDIAGQDKANPIAMFLSGAMMLDWLDDRAGLAEGRASGELIRRAVSNALDAIQPLEIGGDAGTVAITKSVLEAMATLPLEMLDVAS